MVPVFFKHSVDRFMSVP